MKELIQQIRKSALVVYNATNQGEKNDALLALMKQINEAEVQTGLIDRRVRDLIREII